MQSYRSSHRGFRSDTGVGVVADAVASVVAVAAHIVAGSHDPEIRTVVPADGAVRMAAVVEVAQTAGWGLRVGYKRLVHRKQVVVADGRAGSSPLGLQDHHGQSQRCSYRGY